MAEPVRIEKPQTHTHAETGEKQEIPAGSLLVHNGDTVQTMLGPMVVEAEGVPEGELLYWQNPPHTEEGKLADGLLDFYEAKRPRDGTHRRVLQNITDEVDVDATEKNAQARLVPIQALGPRNRPESLAYALARDGDTPGIPPDFGKALARVIETLDDLVADGLAKRRADGSYALTADGRKELVN